MRQKPKTTIVSTALLAAALFAGVGKVTAQTNSAIPQSMLTPDVVETGLGKLTFKDGAPTPETAKTVADLLIFTNGLNVYNNSFRGASAYALQKGFQSIGAEDNTIIIFSELMDAKSLFLTANADTVYYLAVFDLTKGPMVIEQPPKSVGTINDMWFSWIIDIGFPGPDRGEGGKYLIVPPGYDGPLPDSGFHVAHSKTNRVLYGARAYLVNNDPKPAVETDQEDHEGLSLHAGWLSAQASPRHWRAKSGLSENPPVPETKFVEATGKAFNTIPPSDYTFFEMINENVQQEPATSYDVELAGQLAAIGIVKGKPFKPDADTKRVLTDAAKFGNATGRVLNWRFGKMHPDWFYYENSMWGNMLWEGGYNFETPPPMITKEGMFKPFPPTGARTLDSRTAFYYAYTLDSPGMIMRVPRVGSQYLMGFLDADKNPFDGDKTYKCTLPKDIPAAAFWSFTVYDNQSRSMLDTPQRYPRAGSQSYPSPAAVASADGSTTIYFGPETARRRGARQLDPDPARQGLVHHPAPLQSAGILLHEGMACGEIELVK